MSSRRQKRKTDIANAIAEPQSKLINFLSIVGGATFTLVVVFYLISFLLGSNPADPIDDSRGIVQENQDRQTDSETSNSNPDFTFENELAVSKVEELADLLLNMEIQVTGTQIPVVVQNQRKRIRVAEQILMLDHNPDQFQLAVQAKINALKIIYNTWLDVGLSDADNIQQLRKVVQDFRNDNNKSIRRQARLSSFSLESIEKAREKTANRELQSLVDDFQDIILSFPEDPETSQTLLNIVRSVIKTNRDFGVELMEELAKTDSNNVTPSTQRLLRDLHDELIMTKRDFRKMLPGSIRDRTVSIEQLAKTALELIQIPEAGETIMVQVTYAATALEQQGAIEKATAIFQGMVDIADEKSLPEISDSFRDNGLRGLTRIEAIGAKLLIQGTLLEGSALNPSVFENSWSVLIFWAAGPSVESNNLANHLRSLVGLNETDVKILVLLMNDQFDSILGTLPAQFPSVYFAVADQPNPDQPSILEQFPANIVPQAVVLNPEGVMIRSNLPLKNLSNEVNELIKK